MSDLLLVFAPRGALNQPPLGLASLKSYLRQKGIDAKCRDLSAELFLQLPKIPAYYWDDDLFFAEEMPDSVDAGLMSFLAQVGTGLAQAQPRLLGFTLLVGNVWTTMWLARFVKQLAPEIPIVVGGPECAVRWPTLLREPAIDYVIIGDGEEPLLRLLTEGPAAAADIPGLLTRDNPAVPVLSQLPVLDDLPAPDFDDFALDLYFRQQTPGHAELPIMRSKGCVFSCPFCSRKVHDDGYRITSDHHIAKILSQVSHRYGVTDFYFVDSLINPSARAMVDLSHALTESGTDYRWRANASLSSFMSRQVLEQMHQAGCRRLSYGLESGSASVRRSIRKSDQIDAVERILRDTKELGITVSTWMMVGFPTEGEDEFRESVEFLKRNSEWIDEVQISKCSVIPGTGLALEPNKWGITTFGFGQDWSSATSTPIEREHRLTRLTTEAARLGLLSTRAL